MCIRFRVSTRTTAGMVLGVFLIGIQGCSVQPTPLEPRVVGDRAAKDLEQLQLEEPRPNRPVTLEMALEMALNHNLEQRVKMVEAALAHGQLNLALQQMLPGVSGSWTRHERTRDAASFSESIKDGSRSVDDATALEKIYSSGDVTLVWNLLDFGVSYIHSRQQADDWLIAAQRHRKVVMDIIRDVRFAFWRAAGAEAMLPEVESNLQSVRMALSKSKRLERERLQSSDEAMDYQEELLRQIQLLMELQKEMLQAKTRLAALMNIRPGTPYVLEVGNRDRLEVPEVAFSSGQLEELAMVSRSELLEEDYQERISAMETRIALLKLLPGLKTTLSGQYDDNRYLKHSGWGEVAYGLSYSLNDLLATPQRIRTAQIRQQLVIARRLAMAMTILTQVNLALQEFYQAKNDFAIADELHALKKRQMLRESAAKSVRGGASLALERRQIEFLVAAMQRDRSYAQLQNAYGMILHSVGMEQLPPVDQVQGHDVFALARYVHEQRHPGDSLELRTATEEGHRFDQVLQWFGVASAGSAPRPVQSRTWTLRGTSNDATDITDTRPGKGSPPSSQDSIPRGETKKWVLVDR
ncbi:MAG: TolC family protein [Magnetococcales bacterium]|nr:TolC family protein [Magnetococcales bacterium]MBF0150321.1 TolC family protein [Magnetococcales bacterium]